MNLNKIKNKVRTEKVKAGQTDVPEKSAEQIAFERKWKKNELEVRKQNMKSAVNSKKEQLAGEIIETRTVHQIPDGTAVIVDGFKDGVKPRYLLENEIRDLNSKIGMIDEQLNKLEGENVGNTS